ncbi:hypothetical protein HDV00_010823 [Rhizophlyctis rosea]|nr:hypothetical protein HDV00_010823 [Rhizophlyctis rosea]
MSEKEKPASSLGSDLSKALTAILTAKQSTSFHSLQRSTSAVIATFRKARAHDVFTNSNILEELHAALRHDHTQVNLGACLILASLLKLQDHAVETYLASTLPGVVELCSTKKDKTLRETALSTFTAFACISPFYTIPIIVRIFEGSPAQQLMHAAYTLTQKSLASQPTDLHHFYADLEAITKIGLADRRPQLQQIAQETKILLESVYGGGSGRGEVNVFVKNLSGNVVVLQNALAEAVGTVLDVPRSVIQYLGTVLTGLFTAQVKDTSEWKEMCDRFLSGLMEKGEAQDVGRKVFSMVMNDDGSEDETRRGRSESRAGGSSMRVVSEFRDVERWGEMETVRKNLTPTRSESFPRKVTSINATSNPKLTTTAPSPTNTSSDSSLANPKRKTILESARMPSATKSSSSHSPSRMFPESTTDSDAPSSSPALHRPHTPKTSRLAVGKSDEDPNGSGSHDVDEFGDGHGSWGEQAGSDVEDVIDEDSEELECPCGRRGTTWANKLGVKFLESPNLPSPRLSPTENPIMPNFAEDHLQFSGSGDRSTTEVDLSPHDAHGSHRSLQSNQLSPALQQQLENRIMPNIPEHLQCSGSGDRSKSEPGLSIHDVHGSHRSLPSDNLSPASQQQLEPPPMAASAGADLNASASVPSSLTNQPSAPAFDAPAHRPHPLQLTSQTLTPTVESMLSAAAFGSKMDAQAKETRNEGETTPSDLSGVEIGLMKRQGKAVLPVGEGGTSMTPGVTNATAINATSPTVGPEPSLREVMGMLTSIKVSVESGNERTEKRLEVLGGRVGRCEEAIRVLSKSVEERVGECVNGVVGMAEKVESLSEVVLGCGKAVNQTADSVDNLTERLVKCEEVITKVGKHHGLDGEK